MMNFIHKLFEHGMKRTLIRDIIGLFLVTRIILLLVTYFGYILLTQDKYANTPIDIFLFLNTWQRWDAILYVRIANIGYLPPFDLAFFPLFPLLIRMFTAPIGGNTAYLFMGMLLSNLALLGALLVISQLAVEVGGEKVARRTLLYLCIFPTAFFFFAAYNESLFLLLSSATFLAIRRQRWLLAGLLGALASATRTTGVLLTIPLLYELWLARAQIVQSMWNISRALLALLLIPLGMMLYAIYCWQLTGNPLAFAAVQSNWSRQLTFPWHGLWQAFFELFWNQPFGSFNQVHVLLDLSATLGFIALGIIGIKKIRTSYSVWLALLLLSTLMSASIHQHDSLISNQRFVLEMFPGFIVLGLLGWKYPRLHQALCWIFPALLATLSLLFVMGKWMV